MTALKYLVREQALLEMLINSVQRIVEFSSVPQEALPEVRSNRIRYLYCACAWLYFYAHKANAMSRTRF